jgi:hypothetical protein
MIRIATMRTDIMQLNDLMADEAGIFKEMIQALEVEKEAAIGADLAALEDSRLEKVTCADRLKASAARRARIIKRLAGDLGAPSGVSTFEALLTYLDSGATGELRATRDEISALAEIADSKNRENAVYLEQGLKVARGTLALAENIGNPQTEYQKTGLVKTGRPTGRLLSKNY